MKTSLTAKITLALILFGTLISFGGAPRSVFLISSLALLGCALYTWRTAPEPIEGLPRQKFNRALTTFFAVLFIGTAFWPLLSLGNFSHPILGTTNFNSLTYAAESCTYLAIMFIAFQLAYKLASSSVEAEGVTQAVSLERLIIAIGSILAVIALVHWPLDSGLLFGTFQPDNRFISPRARWPFVNANHLGHCMALLLPFCATLLIANVVTTLGKSKSGRFDATFWSRAAFSWVGLGGPFLLMLVALLLSQTRSSLIGAIIGIIFAASFLIPDRKLLAAASPNTPPSRRARQERAPATVAFGFNSKLAQLRTFISAGIRRTTVKQVTLLSFMTVIAVSALLVFRESGQAVIKARLGSQSLSASVNTRLELLESTLQLISKHPVFGVGPGGWQPALTVYGLQPSATDFTPQFAHNEVIQLLAEFGIPIGALLIIVLVRALYAALSTIRARAPVDLSTEPSYPLALAGLAGLIGLLPGLLVDFPLRLFGLALLITIILGATCRALDELRSN